MSLLYFFYNHAKPPKKFRHYWSEKNFGLFDTLHYKLLSCSLQLQIFLKLT